MATLGIKNVQIALVDKTGAVIKGTNGIFKDAKDTSGIFTADQDTAFGVASLALSNLTGTTTDIYGSNKLVHKSAGKGSASSVLTVNALPHIVKQAILGNAPDGKGGFTIDGKADSNNLVAILAESAEAFNDAAPVYVGMFMGIASEAALTMTTNNAAENRSTDAITIAGVERGDDGFGKYYFSSVSGFDKSAMQADVFKTATAPSSGGTTGQ